MDCSRVNFVLTCLVILDVMYRLMVQLQLLVYFYCKAIIVELFVLWSSKVTSVNMVLCGPRCWQYIWSLRYSNSAGKGQPIFNISGTICCCYKFKTLIGSIFSDIGIN